MGNDGEIISVAPMVMVFPADLWFVVLGWMICDLAKKEVVDGRWVEGGKVEI